MFSELVEDFKAHAEEAAPQESCGMVIDREDGTKYIRCDNVAETPEKAFHIADDVLLSKLKDKSLLAIIHSHPYPHPAAPSFADMSSQMAMNVPWAIVPVSESGEAAEPFWCGDSVPKLPLLGRSYRHGITDCYSIVRDWYQLERGITLKDYPRQWGWWLPHAPAHIQNNLYLDNFANDGVEVDRSEAVVGDVLLLQIRSDVINHAGVLCEPGILLHHGGGAMAYDPSSLSKRENAARWMDFVVKVVRHKND